MYFLLSFSWSSGEKRGEKRESARRGLEGVLGRDTGSRKGGIYLAGWTRCINKTGGMLLKGAWKM